MSKSELTPRQAAFVSEYLIDLNATQAAVRAGYSPHTANEQGARLLANVRVSAAVSKGQQERAAKLDRKSQDVLRDIQKLTKEARAKGDLKTALRGLEIEGKHLGMFTDRHEVRCEPTRIKSFAELYGDLANEGKPKDEERKGCDAFRRFASSQIGKCV